MPTTATIREATIAEIREHGGALRLAHWIEVGAPHQVEGLDPDWSQYEASESEGGLVTLAAWQGDDLVGYSVSVWVMHPHSRDQGILHNDALFVSEKARRTGIGLSLMKATETVAEAGGVQMVWGAKPGSRFDRLLRKRKGFVIHEHVYMKERS